MTPETATLPTPPRCAFHTPGYYWKQTHYVGLECYDFEQFRLIGPNLSKPFRSFEELEAYCKRNGIDAAQA